MPLVKLRNAKPRQDGNNRYFGYEGIIKDNEVWVDIPEDMLNLEIKSGRVAKPAGEDLHKPVVDKKKGRRKPKIRTPNDVVQGINQDLPLTFDTDPPKTDFADMFNEEEFDAELGLK